MRTPARVEVVGSGPNGLAAAAMLARAGFPTTVWEAQAELGGACRNLPLTLPGFTHDFGSAVHPLGAGSPVFRGLGLEQHGLTWVHHPAPLAHPLDDGTAVTLERGLAETVDALGRDGETWKGLIGPVVEAWEELTPELLGPIPHFPRHPLLLARFGLFAAQPARLLAGLRFREERTRALFAGLAGHSFQSLDAPFSSAVALVLGAAAHAVGWPIPRGGSGAITHALAEILAGYGGVVRISSPVRSLDEDAITVCDVRADCLPALAGPRLPRMFSRRLARFKPGPGSFKLDYALHEPIPWKATDCRRASTVHLGGTMGEIARGEQAVLRGRMPERPFVLLAQPTLADPTRAPAGKHIAWAYCHVPFGSKEDAAERIEAQIERFAPGFRDCVLHRTVSGPHALEAADENLRGGDISGGAMDPLQLLFRPSIRPYATPDPRIFLCSSSTPPGGGVHGMCGYHAARAVLRRW